MDDICRLFRPGHCSNCPPSHKHTHTIKAIPSRFQSTRALDENITDSECLFNSPLKLFSQFKAIGPFWVWDPDAVEHTPPDFCQEMPPVEWVVQRFTMSFSAVLTHNTVGDGVPRDVDAVQRRSVRQHKSFLVSPLREAGSQKGVTSRRFLFLQGCKMG